MIKDIITVYSQLLREEDANEEAPTFELIRSCARCLAPDYAADINQLLEDPLTLYAIPANMKILAGTILDLLITPQPYQSSTHFINVLLETNGPAISLDQLYNELIVTFKIQPVIPPHDLTKVLATKKFNNELLMVAIISYTISQL